MLRYYVFFYLFCVSVTLYIGYRGIIEYDDEPPAKVIEGQRGSEDTRGRRSKRDVGDSRVLGFDLFLQKLEELRRVATSLKLQKLQRHHPETFKQKKEKKQADEKKDKGEEEDLAGGQEGQSSTNSDQSQSRPSKPVGRQNAEKSEEKEEEGVKEEEEDPGEYPGSSQGKEDWGGRGGKSRKRRQIIDKIGDQLKGGVKYLETNNDKNMGGVYMQNPNEYFDEEKQMLEDGQVQEGVAKSLFVDNLFRTLLIFLGLQLLIAGVVGFAIWAQAYIRYDIWHFKQGDMYDSIKDFFSDWDQDVGIGDTERTAALNEKLEIKSEKVEDRMMDRDDWIEKMQEKRDEKSAMRQFAKAQAERNQEARDQLEDLEMMEENLEKQAKKLSKQKKKAEKKTKHKTHEKKPAGP